MERDNVLQFPYPVHDLSHEAVVFRLTELTEELETALSGWDEQPAQQLGRIEKASILLKDISLLASLGTDRKRAAETFERITLSIAELRLKLQAGQEL